ncbi:MBL fold metallo-hydrolase [Alsobacter sp. SYSU M60028]|uniref:MBL fold metallo-hydrolase n=1 Tax=Alsobacter ponti TaxID=2962936 RepID=A0ABT1LJ85_9HYPH|nr:MBL fold metallo-hydrolase [Alsobacter ponti]MCP8940790.1 MBL fold metallo-hydrolase [Alsobacter ponti]
MSITGRAGLAVQGATPTTCEEAGLFDGISVRFWGTRGSFPVADSRFMRYGGNTSCVEVRVAGRLFILDAGSGLIGLGQMLQHTGPIDLLLSHLHHDHVTGLAFFQPLFKPCTTLRIHCGNLGGESARAALDRMFDEPLFPLRLDQLSARIEHIGFEAGETLHFEDGLKVRTCPLVHPGGATGYRFDHNGRSLCYVSDVEHAANGPSPSLVSFVEGADLVIYDTTYTEQEYVNHRGWGHSTWEAGVELCKAAGARSLAAFHHHPFRDDAALEAVEARLAEALPGSFVAREVQSCVLSTHHEYPFMIGV